MSYVFHGGENKRRKSRISIDIVVILMIAVFFCIRCIVVLNNYRERGAYAYVQLLNYCIPVVKELNYDASDYAENNLSIRNVILQSLGLSNLKFEDIVNNELPVFAQINGSITGAVTNNSIQPYQIKSNSVDMITEEEKEAIEKESPAYDEGLKKILDEANPEVFIYHTHTHESYYDGGNVDEGYNYNTDNDDYNVVGVGDVLAEELKEGYGIAVIHDKTIHDTSYNDCYGRANETVSSYLKEYGDFKLIIDLHRDSSSNRQAVTAEINGQTIAKIMFVIAGNSSNYFSNVELDNKLIEIINRLFPSILRSTDIFVYDSGINAFNLYLSNNMILLEARSIANTSTEAKLSAKYIARVIAEYIKNYT
ncbi:MAG: stage II sporulation protein P [Clostridium sp.]|nr:stage II sporulation protein P [Clostridium sp.]